MEKDNIKRDENLQEDSVVEETAINNAEEAKDVCQEPQPEVVETVEEEAFVPLEPKEEPVAAEDIEEAELSDAEEADNEIVAEVELTEEDIAKMEAYKKKERKKNLIIAAIAAVIVAITVFFACYTEGVGSNNIVSNPDYANQAADEGFWSKLKTDNIRYENPIVALFDKLTGKNADVAMKVNGMAVDKDVLGFVTNSSSLNCAYSLIQTGLVQDVSKFDWDEVDPQFGLSYLEISKAMAVESLVPMYASIAEAEKHGIKFTDEDDKKIKDWISEQKTKYGTEFETVLKTSGYADEAALYEIQKIQLYMQKFYEDVEKDPTKYITEGMKKNISDDKVTVKHILITFEAAEDGSVSDDAKAKAKKSAEEVLAKVKAGEDFDALVEEYNQDPGATDEGYTFAQDGSMVEPFETASFALKVGETSELVETNYGYHIIKRLERKLTAEDYIAALQKTATVNIKKGVFDNMKITINLNDYFGQPQEQAAEAEAE